jgi:hypothetical protein
VDRRAIENVELTTFTMRILEALGVEPTQQNVDNVALNLIGYRDETRRTLDNRRHWAQVTFDTSPHFSNE